MTASAVMAVFYDPRYPSSMVEDHDVLAKALRQRGGYEVMDARRLREWMLAGIEAGAAGAVCVMAHGIAPDTVAESPSSSCTLRRFMDSGGRVVWIGDIPFFYQGERGIGGSGPMKAWGDDAHQRVLGIPWAWSRPGKAEITDAGKAWGITLDDAAHDCVPEASVTVVLSRSEGYACSYFLNFNPAFPQSGFVRYRASAFQGELDYLVDELIRVASYDVEEPAEVPEEKAPGTVETTAEGTAVLVETGGLRVDRARAMDKLMRFQLHDPTLYLLPWVRSAVQSRATGIRLVAIPEGIQMSFDGTPFAPTELKDPYGCLFEGSHDPRRRDLALGLLAVLRLKPKAISVVSGHGAERHELRVDSLSEDRFEHSRDPGTDTVIRVSWGGFSGVQGHLWQVAESCGACRIPIWVGDRKLEPRRAPESLPGLVFDKDGLFGILSITPAPMLGSRLDLSVSGVRACTVDNPFPVPQVEGVVDHPRFRLNVSQSGVSRDVIYAQAMAAALKEVLRLAEGMIEELERDFPVAACLAMEGGFAGLWGRTVRLGFDAGPGPLSRLIRFFSPLSGRASEAERLVRRTARMADWMRQLCVRVAKESPAGIPEDLMVRVWETPLYFRAGGGTYTLRQLELMRKDLGDVRVCPRSKPGVFGADAVCCFDGREGASLEGIFRDEVKVAESPMINSVRELRAVLGQRPSKTLACESAAGRRWTELEVLLIGASVARQLQEKHGFEPPVVHGCVCPECIGIRYGGAEAVLSEFVRGQGKSVRSDIYALGKCLDSILGKPGRSAASANILYRMLSSRPEEQFSSAEELRKAFVSALAGR
ncbi:MAG: hypothetical protein WC728_03150 [Elusimicrobiota bacterium]